MIYLDLKMAMLWKELCVFLLLCLYCFECRIVDSDCSKPLGVEDGRIRDSQMRASSSYSHESVGASAGRLNSEKGGGAWCPKNLITENMETQEFLEIDLEYNHIITAVVTQGRFANGRGAEFAEFYILQYWREGMNSFVDHTDDDGEKILEANKNTFAAVETKLDSAILASKIRIIPFSKHARTICLRAELKGCTINNSDPQTKLDAKPDLEEDEIEVDIEDMKEVLTDTLDDPFLESEYMGVAVGVLVTVILLLMIVIVFILYKNYLGPGPSSLPYSHHDINTNNNYNCGLDLETGTDMVYAVGKNRALQLTPTTSEDNYTDSSVEYSSPLLYSHFRKESTHSRIQPVISSRSHTSPREISFTKVPLVSSHSVHHPSLSSEMTPGLHRTVSSGSSHGILKNGSARERQKSSPSINWQTFFPAPPPLQQSHYDEPNMGQPGNKRKSGLFVV